MPTYDYECDACDHKFEEFQSMMDDPLKKCPKCGRKKLRRLLGTGAAIIFKGSGFYQTDYRSESYRSSAKADEAKAKGTKARRLSLHYNRWFRQVRRRQHRGGPVQGKRQGESRRPERPMMESRCPVWESWMRDHGPKDWPSWPFCSSRCKLIDLGRWLGGVYRPGSVAQDSPED